MRMPRTFFAAAYLLLSPFVFSFGEAQAETKLLLIGEGVGRDSLSPGDPLFRNIMGRLSVYLNSSGITVILMTKEPHPRPQERPRAVSVPTVHDLMRSRTEDGVVFAGALSIYATTDKDQHTTRVTTGLSVKLFGRDSDKALGLIDEKSPTSINAPVDCARTCLLNIVESSADKLAQKLAPKVAAKMESNQQISPVGEAGIFRLVFKGYTREDLLEIEAFLPAFKGYNGHSVIESTSAQRIYRYDTALQGTALDESLERMLRYVGVSGQVTVDGSLFTVENVSGSNDR